MPRTRTSDQPVVHLPIHPAHHAASKPWVMTIVASAGVVIVGAAWAIVVYTLGVNATAQAEIRRVQDDKLEHIEGHVQRIEDALFDHFQVVAPKAARRLHAEPAPTLDGGPTP